LLARVIAEPVEHAGHAAAWTSLMLAASGLVQLAAFVILPCSSGRA
jgi:hypothetical protein